MANRIFAGAILCFVVFFSFIESQPSSTVDPVTEQNVSNDLYIKVNPEKIPYVKLNVPYMSQVPPGDWRNTKNCVPASFVMCYAYQKHLKPIPQMIKDFDDWALKVKGIRHNNYNGFNTGYSLLRIEEYTQHLGLKSRSVCGNLPQIIELLKAGKPVLVSVKDKLKVHYKDHAMLVVGITPKNIILHDPYSLKGAYNQYPIKQFLAAWKTKTNSMLYITED
jgi:hypothetical protein